MEIYSKIDSKSNLIKSPLVLGEDVFGEIEEPILWFNKDKRKRYDERVDFISYLETWNTKGFDTLASFLFYFLNDVKSTIITNANPANLSFTILTGEGKLEVQLVKRVDRDSHPMIIVKHGSLIKEYVCDNMGKKGLLIDLMTITIQNENRSLTRSFNSNGFVARIRGYGYLNEITMGKNQKNKKMLFNEEAILASLLTEHSITDVFDIFKILHSYASEEMASKTINVRHFMAQEGNALLSEWEEIQSLKVFGSLLISYENKNPFEKPLVGTFTRKLYEDYEYLDRITGDIKEPKTKEVFKSEQDRCEEFITFLNSYTDKGVKELKYQPAE